MIFELLFIILAIFIFQYFVSFAVDSYLKNKNTIMERFSLCGVVI
jgi:hypothetical protein